MEINEYQKQAMETLNKDLKEKDDILLNSVMGLCGESGEAIDIVKKYLFQKHPLNKVEFVKELGDIAWYLAEASYSVGYDLETVCKMNIEKLKTRYPNGFSYEDSLKRVDEKK